MNNIGTKYQQIHTATRLKPLKLQDKTLVSLDKHSGLAIFRTSRKVLQFSI